LVHRLQYCLSILLGVMSAYVLVPYGHTQSPAPHAQVQSHIPIQTHQIALVSVSCTPNPAKVFTGAIVAIQAEGRSLQGLALRYSFAADAGQLSESGAIARLNTAGLGARTVHISCTATDTAGRSASQTVEVVVMGAPHTEELHLPAHQGQPPPIIVAPQGPKPAQGQAAKPPEVVSPPPTPHPVPQPIDHQAVPGPVPVQETPKPATPTPDTPAQGVTPAPVQTDVTPAPMQPTAPDAYKASTEMETWVNQLKQGKIEYKVPQKMLLLQAATVTVVIHGYQDVNTATLIQPTGSASLKQSPRMKVELLPEDDPDAFTIAIENGDAVKDVLSNGATTWIWKVTPNKSGAKQHLKILASLMYPNTDKTEIQLQDYHTTVEVDVASLWSTVVDDYQHDPMKFFSYMIPGGAGFTFIAGLVVWWWRRKHKDEKD
jgi:outer membrane biosynthesis protein TonB